MPEALPDELHAAVSLGLLLLASLAGGIVADLLRVPKVTAYLLAGMLAGPSLAHWITVEQLHQLAPLTKLAMALVLLELGYHFPLAHLRPILRHALWLSTGELLATFAIVFMVLFTFGGSFAVAVLLGVLALATAPATTILVLKEAKSEGPVTELASVLVALNNIAAIVLFEVVFLAARLTTGQLEKPALEEVARVLAELGGATCLGIIAGLVISYGTGFLSQRRWLVMLLAISVLVLGLCESYHWPYMLSFLIAGMVVVNTSDSVSELLSEQEKVGGLLVVVFFAVHGAELQLAAFLSAGALGLIYIVARCAGKILGIRWMAKLRGEATTVCRYLGSTLLAQAGAALALAALAAERWPEVGEQLQVIILGSVVFFEIAGPICIRWAVLTAGEVPLAQAISHRTATATSQASHMWRLAREAVGIKPSQPPNLQELTVKDLLRSNVKGILQTCNFEEVVEYIRRSHDNTYFVVDANRNVVGVIRYAQLSDVFFDSSIDSLVRAEDLASPVVFSLSPDQRLTEAVELFRQISDDVLPVVEKDAPHAQVGILRQSDLTDLAIRFRP